VDDDIVTRHPVDRGGDPVLIAGLQAVEDTENLGSVAAGGGGVREDETDGLLGVDDEDGANGERNALGVDVGGILVVGNFSWEPEISSMSLIQPSWLSMVLAERPMSFAPRLVNSGSSLAKAPSSVVQTGV
jgi:hypothetical protein